MPTFAIKGFHRRVGIDFIERFLAHQADDVPVGVDGIQNG